MPRFLSARPGFRTALVSALIFCGTVLLFSPALRCGFLNYDDPAYITDNPKVQGGLSWEAVVWAFTSPTDYWHPLAWLSHIVDWQVYGSSAFGHHLTSVLWHALNAVLVFLVFRRLEGGFWSSAFAAALFAWHPLRVESVVWVSERKDVLSACFFLLTLLAYARYVDDRQAGRPGWRSYALTVVCFAVGLTAKSTLVTLPLLLLILDAWPFGRCPSPARLRGLVLEKLPLFVLSGVVSVATVLTQRHQEAMVLDLPWDARAGNAVVSLARYLGKFFWPFDLIVCYPHPGYWPTLAVAAASALALGLSWFAWQQRRTRPWIAVGWLWYLVVLLPVIGLLQVGFQAMADRYSYLSLLGIELALVWSLSPVWRSPRLRLGAGAVAATLLAALGVRTWDQQGAWRDSVSLFAHAVAASTDNGTAEDFLASALLAADRFDEAAVHAERACALNPRSDTAFITFAGVRERQGRMAEALALYRTALELRPENARVQMEIGMLELSMGRVDEARRTMTAALRAAPALCERTLQIGHNALGQRDARAALFFYGLVLAVLPDNAEAHAGVGMVLLAQNDAAGAIDHLRAATAGDPALAEAQLALARCAEQLGRPDEAVVALQRALAAAPDDPAIHYGAAEARARRGDFAEAIRLCRRAVELAPIDPAPQAALGHLLIHTGERAAGLAAWRRALELDPDYPGLREQMLKESAKP